MYSGNLEAEKMTSNNTIPPQAYKTTADLGRFIDCIFRVINCGARSHVGWPVAGTEVRQVLYLAGRLYRELYDERFDAVEKDHPKADLGTLDMMTSTRFNRLPKRSHLQATADAEVRRDWCDILVKHFEKEEEE